ncbi:hypothetical protein E2C01_039179 [Portunus trituberculatus]|uniref:Uncharacterized protein n=1 Tax=Portunus trituberculatus TaxID=210409 RepID=A0A5B7FCZ3_PORTR|nr:hypothetical protein [Portunus trituberculatus]
MEVAIVAASVVVVVVVVVQVLASEALSDIPVMFASMSYCKAEQFFFTTDTRVLLACPKMLSDMEALEAGRQEAVGNNPAWQDGRGGGATASPALY